MIQVSGREGVREITGWVMIAAGRVVSVAPPLAFMLGWTVKRFREYVRKHAWVLREE